MNSDLDFLGGTMLIVLGLVIIVLVLAVYLMSAIGKMKILKKAGKDGWPAFIPYYGDYVLCQVVGVNPWWVLIVAVASLVGGNIPVIGSLLVSAVSIYFSVLISVSLARSFGKEDSFAVGLVLLSPVFLLILGFGDSTYKGAKPMDDIVFDKLGISNKNNNTSNSESNENKKASDAEVLNEEEVKDNKGNKDKKYCTNCGTEIVDDTKFCPSCGEEVK